MFSLQPALMQPYIYPVGETYLNEPEGIIPIYVQTTDHYNGLETSTSPPSPTTSFGSESAPQIIDIHPAYSGSVVEGMNPHLMSDKELAEVFRGSSQHMELVWHGVFNLLMRALTNPFTLEPAFGQEPHGDLWSEMKEDAKVRFKCQKCGKGWTSMKGKIAFFYKFDYTSGVGEVKFQLFGQKCMQCMPDTFEHAMWYPQEVIRVLKLLTYRIGQTVYHIPKPKVLRIRRGGSPKEKHEKDMCQACQQGMCSSAN